MKTLALSEVQLVETYKQTLLFENDLEKHVSHDPNVCAIRQIQQTCWAIQEQTNVFPRTANRGHFWHLQSARIHA